VIYFVLYIKIIVRYNMCYEYGIRRKSGSHAASLPSSLRR
jgi:hypothetical protein